MKSDNAQAPAPATGIRSPHQWRLWLSGLIGARYDGLTHFQIVKPGVLYRCGQPRNRDLEQIRDKHGLKTIICARGGTRHPLRGRWFRKERRWAQENQIRFEHLRLSDQAATPGAAFDIAIDILADPANHPVLVHCEQGFHRTGVLCAAFRVTLDNWTTQAALEEMKSLGFDPADAKRKVLITALREWLQTHSAQKKND
jgi:tyrosine-protein phosphatase SIW14